jgi:hypothetical protein
MVRTIAQPVSLRPRDWARLDLAVRPRVRRARGRLSET